MVSRPNATHDKRMTWMRKTTLGVLSVSATLAIATAGCGANSSGGGSGDSSGSNTAGNGGGPKVGVILPETATSARWATFDKPMLTKALKAKGLTPIIENAQGNVQKFSQIADSMLSKHVKVLVIAPINSASGAQVESEAKKQGVPVVDYDRPTLGGSAHYYVSFNNKQVGVLQGKAMAEALKDKPGADVIEIEGAPTDNNATLFYKGQQKVLKPLYDSGKLNLVDSRAIDKWDNQKGGKVFEQLLTANGGTVDGVVAANDGLAGAVITVLKKNHLAGKVPVTGQDATAAGLKDILRGYQSSTVFKPVKKEAQATAKLVKALVSGNTAKADKIASGSMHDPKGKRDLKAVLLKPTSVTIDNVALPIKKGYVKAGEVCQGDLAAKCAKHGIETS